MDFEVMWVNVVVPLDWWDLMSQIFSIGIGASNMGVH
jgi:hypothetical protein